MDDQQSKEELERIRNVYEGYRTSARFGHLWGGSAASLQLWHRRMVKFYRLLHRYGITSLEGLRVLDVGCGDGLIGVYIKRRNFSYQIFQ